MNNRLPISLLAGASSAALGLYVVPAQAQEVAAAASGDSAEIIVTARRRDESSQDVPLVVNAVTPETIDNLQIKKFEDLSAVVPGLNLNKDNTASGATLRGVNFNPYASGNNATVEFYMNDTPIAAQVLFQTLFDVGQIEVLRGPQGTLRGRASPSGSITVTTRRPDLYEFGATGEVSFTTHDRQNIRLAANFPLIKDVLAVRFAGMFDRSDGNRVHSINTSAEPFDRTWAGRATVLFKPTDNLTITAMYQHAGQKQRQFSHVESGRVVDPTAPVSPVFIAPYDNLAVADDSFVYRADFTDITWGAEWKFAGQRLNYVGGRHILDNGPYNTSSDPGNFFDSTYTQPQLRNYGQLGFHSRQYQDAHELRLSSEERLFGMLDYVVGVFQQKTSSPTDYQIQTPVIAVLGTTSTTAPVSYSLTGIGRQTHTTERSVFANVNMHLGDRTELSGGLRYINYKVLSDLLLSGTPIAAAHEDSKFNTVIYSASLKHRFSDQLMVYASFGTSWRPGIFAVGDFSLAQSPLERSFIILPPEESKSYEVGFKSNLLDRRLTFNVSYFHQTFNNYPYRANSGIPFVSTGYNTQLQQLTKSVAFFNFVAPVPAKVDGVEAELNFRATPNFSIGGSLAYANGRFTGVVPCNDYAPFNGIPDNPPTIPTVATIEAVANGNNLVTCNVSRKASDSPRWSGTVTTEYHHEVSSSAEAYIRGFATIYGDSLNDEGNPYDDIPAYAVVNAFVGVRAQNGSWDIQGYVKNLTNVQRITNRGATLLTTGYATYLGSQTGTTSYRSVSTLEGREFGISLKASFGSR